MKKKLERPYLNTVDLTPEEIQEFQQIVKKIKGIDLTLEQAEEQGMRFVRIARLLMQKRLLENKEIK